MSSSALFDISTVPLPTGRIADLARNANVAVLGFGVSNRPLALLLTRLGAHVHIYDQRTIDELGADAQLLATMGVHFTTDMTAALAHRPALIFRTPGIRPDHPAITAAVAQGAELTSEMAWFLEITPAKVLAITGSDGKTTTSTLTAKMLEADGKRVYLGGNIGRPLLPLATSMTHDDFAVVELSSFQLFDLPARCVPHRAVLTNLTPNHLNWHLDMEEYTRAKTRIYEGARCERLVTNADNAVTASLAAEQMGKRDMALFSSSQTATSLSATASEVLYLKDGAIMLHKNGRDISVLPVADILLPGRHNIENYMAAIGLVHDLVSFESIRAVATTFGGVEHRLEIVRTLRGVTYYNSSIDSTPTRTAAALSAFDPQTRIVAICGGYDKNIDFAPLAKALCERVSAVVLTGATSDKILSAIYACPAFDSNRLAVCVQKDFETAVHTAASLAHKGDAVLLSPACASFDAFPNFEVRGRTFKRIVQELDT